jgi:hypothetical protein
MLGAAMAAGLLMGCAVDKVRGGPLGPVVDAGEQIALVAAETRLTAEIRERIADVVATPPTPSQARQLAIAAQAAFAVVQVGRIAWDVVLRSTAAEATIAAVDAARRATNEALSELQNRLALIIAPPV